VVEITSIPVSSVKSSKNTSVNAALVEPP